jgi:halocyanin-like protein
MDGNDADVSRRGFMLAAAGTTALATTGAGGTALAQENETSGNQTSGNQTSGNQTSGNESSGGGGGGGPPDFGGYLDDANNYSSVSDQRGSNNVLVEVGAGSNGLAFGPAAVHVDNGATVTWEWTGEGGAHNVVSEDGVFESGSPQESGTYEYTFEEDGIYNYYCSPHKGQGMKGSVVVGSNYPTLDTGGDVGPGDLPSAAKSLGIGTMVVMVATLGMAYFFMRFGGDYGDYE